MAELAGRLTAISVLTRMEVDYGLALNAERARKRAPMLDAFFSTIATLPFDEADAKAAAAIRVALQIMGQPIRVYDALIAGAGLARGARQMSVSSSELADVHE